MPLLSLLVLAAGACGLLSFRCARRPDRNRSARCTGALLVLSSLLASLAGLEGYFALLHDQSDGFALSYAGRKWMERHFIPVNSLGYRDVEPAPPADGVFALAVVGDSFASGHGVDRADDRFVNLLGKALGPTWRVYCVAKPGWDTKDELAALKSYPVKPRMVVLAYYVNDIYGAAAGGNYPLATRFDFPQNKVLAYLVDHSALVNYVYWRMSRQGRLVQGEKSFWETLRSAYDAPEIWAAHLREID